MSRRGSLRNVGLALAVAAILASAEFAMANSATFETPIDVTSGRAYGFGEGAKHGFVRIRGAFDLPAGAALDLVAPGISATIDELLVEELGTGEVAHEVPIPLVRRFFSRNRNRDLAIFETPPGYRVGTADVFARISVVTCTFETGTLPCPLNTELDVFKFQLDAFNLTFDALETCSPALLTTSFVFDDGVNPPLRATADSVPWRCFRDGRSAQTP